jgi:hypothetical protein
MKPRRNEEAQAHIGLSSHRKKNILPMYNEVFERRYKIVSSPVSMFTVIKEKHFRICSETNVYETETWVAEVTCKELRKDEPFLRNWHSFS